MNGGEEMRICTSFAPASRRRLTISHSGSATSPLSSSSIDCSLAYGFAYRAELYSHLIDSLVLTGRDESSADIFVFYEAHSVGYPRRLGIAQSGVDSRIRDAHNNIGFNRMGLKESHAVSVTLYAQTMAQSVRKEKKGTRIITELRFPENEKVDKRVYPERIQVNCFTTKNGKRSEVALTIYGKPAVRLPESYWLSFTVPGIESVIAEKMGERVNLMDVVEKGNRQMHGIDRYVDLITSGETIRISSKEAFLLNVGEAQGLNYSTNYPDKRKGVHFNLNNNLWGTNFSMWNEGSLTYHFVIETLSRK